MALKMAPKVALKMAPKVALKMAPKVALKWHSSGTQVALKMNPVADAVRVCAEAVIAARHIIVIDNIFFLMLLSLMIDYLRKQMSMVLHLLSSSDGRSAHLSCHCQASSCPLPIVFIRSLAPS